MPGSPACGDVLGATVPVLAIDTGSTPLKIFVLAVIVAAIMATRLGPRRRP